MNKKLLTIIILTVVLLTAMTALFFFISPQDILQKLPYISQFSNNTSIVIKTSRGKATVEIDGEDYGETPVELSTLQPGTYEITLTRISNDTEGFYQPLTVLVELNNNTEAVVDIEIGPSGINAGYVLYYTPAPISDSSAYMTISAAVEASINLDSQFIDQTPLNLTKVSTGEHTVTITSAGYEELSIPIVATEGFNLNINTYLFPIPINLEIDNDEA